MVDLTYWNYSYVYTYLKMVLELESLATIRAFETSEDGGLIVRDHVPLQSVDVGKVLLAHLAPLQVDRRVKPRID